MATVLSNMEARPSMLTVVKNGLAASGRSTYLHRVLYIADHKLGPHGIEVHMKNVTAQQADCARDVALTGFLLAYHNYFIHLVEGPESTLTKHIAAVVNSDLEETSQIGRVKILLEMTHINKRSMPSWSSRTAVPPTLATPVKQDASVAEMARHADAVLGKTLRLLEAVKKLPPAAPLDSKTARQLPEPELLEALLATHLIKDVRVVLEEQRMPPRVTLYDDVVWPAQSDFVPYRTLEDAVDVLRAEAPLPQQVAEDEDSAKEQDEERRSSAEQAASVAGQQ